MSECCSETHVRWLLRLLIVVVVLAVVLWRGLARYEVVEQTTAVQITIGPGGERNLVRERTVRSRHWLKP
jgi:hypothetical protein